MIDNLSPTISANGSSPATPPPSLADNLPASVKIGDVSDVSGIVVAGSNNQVLNQFVTEEHLKLAEYHPEGSIYGFDEAATEVITLMKARGVCTIVGFSGSGSTTLGAKCFFMLDRQHQMNSANPPVYWISVRNLLGHADGSSLLRDLDKLLLGNTPFYLVIEEFEALLDGNGDFRPEIRDDFCTLSAWINNPPESGSGVIACTNIAPEGMATYSAPALTLDAAVARLRDLLDGSGEEEAWIRKAAATVNGYPHGLEAIVNARSLFGTFADVFGLPPTDWHTAISHIYHLPANVNEWMKQYALDDDEQFTLKYLSALYDFTAWEDIAAALHDQPNGVLVPQALGILVHKGLVEKRSDINNRNDRGQLRIYHPLRYYIHDAMSDVERTTVYQAAAGYYTRVLQGVDEVKSAGEMLTVEKAIYYNARVGNLDTAYGLFDRYCDQLPRYSGLLDSEIAFQPLMLTELLRAGKGRMQPGQAGGS